MKNDVWKNPVFSISTAIILLLVIIGAISPRQFGIIAGKLFDFSTVNFGWFYLFSVLIITVFLIFLAISKYGTIRIGGENERPEFPFFTWVGMLFSAGFGVGLVFWGVAEPMSHYFSPPFRDIEGLTVEAARTAMGYSFFHWGISQWTVYAIVGLAIGLFQFRKNRNGLVSTALEPVIGKNIIVKHTVDIFSVIATVMGIATSLGLGVLQLNGGFNAVLKPQSPLNLQILIIIILFVAYMLSSSTGLNKGISYLSNLNLGLALCLLLFVFFTGPTIFILESFTLAIGDYITNLFATHYECSHMSEERGYANGPFFIGRGQSLGHRLLVPLLLVCLEEEQFVNLL